MNWTGKRVLVTGAGGFIGSHLTEHLVQLGATTRAFVHYNSLGRRGWLTDSSHAGDIEFFPGDISDPDRTAQACQGIDVVFHLAALIGIPYSYHSPAAYVRTNVMGTLNLLQGGMTAGVTRFVHTSTSETYGTAQYVPIDEGHPLQAQSPYSATKIAADKLVESFHLSFGFPAVTLRPFNTYGPRQSARAVIPTIIVQALQASCLKLGNLHPRRDLTFVSDTVSAFIKAAECDGAIGQTINVGNSKDVSIGELAQLILDMVGRDIPIVSDDLRERPPASEVQRLCANTSKAATLLAWHPSVSLRDGLGITLEWLSQHLDLYEVNHYAV